MNDNLIIDKLNRIKIPQNSTSDIKIKKSVDFQNCIDITINPLEQINYFNLYLIIKSYAHNNIYIFDRLYIRIIKNDDNILTQNLNLTAFLKMDYLQYERWIEHRIKYDLRYYNINSFYCISISTAKELVDDELLDFIKPNYPWSNKIISEMKMGEIGSIIRDRFSEEKNEIIKKQNEEIKKLQQEIRELKGIIKNKKD